MSTVGGGGGGTQTNVGDGGSFVVGALSPRRVNSVPDFACRKQIIQSNYASCVGNNFFFFSPLVRTF